MSRHSSNYSVITLDAAGTCLSLKIRPWLSHAFPMNAPLLESLDLEMEYIVFMPTTKPLFPFGVPHLKIAQISMLDFVSFRFCLAAFQSVTSLRLACIYTGDQGGGLDAYTSFRDGLMALPSLGHLELHNLYDYYNLPLTPVSQLPVVLPALQVLDAYSPFTYGFLDFLGPFIHAASLTVLTLQPGGSRVEDTLDVHFPSVRHLTLLGITRQIPGLGILGQFPSIQRLTCSFSTIIKNGDQDCGIDVVLSALGPGTHEDENTSHRTPCPRLHTVALSDMSPVDRQLDVVALTSKISALQHDGIPIHKRMLPRSVFSQPGLDLEAIAELRKLVEIEDFQIDRPTPFSCERFSRFEEL
ncbi:hypothetical protein FIBSPDRAFT_143180 [Athelia psychrophila]|uniref:F-box domain-containing protein n=1 Tax=Athelia psychrophila TaxID=1759441 RepID=A0A166T1M9_9AGAM|nr:hypothetical protein FIBSPDRAFT_143180 [Fibularhizoctonia sp. CBS 109695]